jgi:hypothetical protein
VAEVERYWQLWQVQPGQLDGGRCTNQQGRAGELGDEDRQDDARVEADDGQGEEPGVANEQPEVAVRARSGPRGDPAQGALNGSSMA